MFFLSFGIEMNGGINVFFLMMKLKVWFFFKLIGCNWKFWCVILFIIFNIVNIFFFFFFKFIYCEYIFLIVLWIFVLFLIIVIRLKLEVFMVKYVV